MADKVRVALVGCGGMGSGHAHTLKAMAGVELSAVVDRDPARVAKFAKEFAAPGFTSVTDMLKARVADAVVSAVTNPFHAEVAVECLEGGLSVLSEKPMALTWADCVRMVEAQGDPVPFLQIGFELRTCPPFRIIREIIDSGELGEVRHVHFLQTPGVKGPSGWKTVRAISGGLFLEKLCHQVDSFRMLLGADPEDVVAISAANVIPWYEIHDNMFATFRFPGGRVAHISFFVGRAAEVERHTDEQYVHKGHWLEYIIVGTKGSISMPLWEMELLVTHNDGGKVTFSRRIELEGGDAEAPYHDIRPELEIFVDSVRGSRRPEQPAEDALGTMRAVFAADKSAAEGGRFVRIDEIR